MRVTRAGVAPLITALVARGAWGANITPRLHAQLESPESGRMMEILSNQPRLQLYTGNFLDGTTVGKSGQAYRQSAG
jgi:galactose mutarotase-like enzyme